MADSSALHPVVIAQVGSEGLALVRTRARQAGARVMALADRDDVARYPFLARALRNIGGLPDRPAQELVLGAITIGIMVATDSWVVDLAGNLVAVLLVNHPHASHKEIAGPSPPSPECSDDQALSHDTVVTS